MTLFKSRSLRIEILVIFLFLISISSITIISFSYYENSRSILKFSRKTIHQVSSLIVEKVDCLFHELQEIPEISSGMFSRHFEISNENEVLITHFLDVIQYHKDLYSFYAANPNGNFMTILNLAVTGTDFLRPDHPECAFAMLLIDRKVNLEYWRYYDQTGKWISTNEFPWSGFDPCSRPWFQGAENSRQIYWTDIFDLVLTKKIGISVAKPVWDQSNALLGVLGASLNLESFSKFLLKQRISPHGRAYILNEEDKIIVSPYQVDETTDSVLQAALQEKSTQVDRNLEVDGEKYLVSVQQFPLASGKKWQVVIIAPFLDFFSGVIQTQRETAWISVGILALAAFLIAYFSRKISDPIVILAHEINKITKLDLDSQARVRSYIREIDLLDSSIVSMRNAVRSFSRYVPKEVVRKLLLKGHNIVLGGEKRNITLMFSDITDLTPIAESLPLETLNLILAEYFDGLSKIILKDHGTIDKYIGDSVMAFWDAMDDMPDHAQVACVAALECQEFVARFNQRQKEKGMPEFKTRIGINTGEVIAGNIGTEERMNYTVIGDVVNIAERLQSMNKIYQTKIIIGEQTKLKIGSQFLTRPLDIAEMKGKKNKIQIFELMAIDAAAKPEDKILAQEFTTAFDAYQSGQLQKAKMLFAAILVRFPRDFPTQLYLTDPKKLGSFNRSQ